VHAHLWVRKARPAAVCAEPRPFETSLRHSWALTLSPRARTEPSEKLSDSAETKVRSAAVPTNVTRHIYITTQAILARARQTSLLLNT